VLSYAKNLIADSGIIFATERPFPVQKANMPPSAYIRTTAFDIASFTPPRLGFGVSAPPKSEGCVIKKILRRSNGAVHVRETWYYVSSVWYSISGGETPLTCTSHTSGQEEFDGSMACEPIMVLLFIVLVIVSALRLVCITGKILPRF
jgi:hypothetical protein